ncbi:MAG: hypothetical protein ABI690_36090 [Chloroflexota bacterium]
MAYQVTWLVENRIVHVLNSGVANAEDVVNSMREAIALLDSGEAPVHMLVESQTEGSDISLGDLLKIIRNNPKSTNIGWAVFVSENKMNRFFGSMGTQISGVQTKTFPTMAEAIAFLKRADITLPEMISLPK